MIERKITECVCAICQQMCRTAPCCPDPIGALLLMKLGYKEKLMVSYPVDLRTGLPWVTIMPIRLSNGNCVFFTPDGKCELHDKGLKPLEGKLAIHDKVDAGLRTAIAYMWVSAEGIEVMEAFGDTEAEVEILKEMLADRNAKKAAKQSLL